MQYIFHFIGNEIIGKDFTVTSAIEDFKQYEGPKINYSPNRITSGEMHIYPHRLLFETGITQQTITCFETEGVKAFFATTGDFPFDIFAASFYLLSRYEEYLPNQPDTYGRFAFENSLAFKEGFLHQPLVNIWLELFREALQNKFTSLSLHASSFLFAPTYDIDMAWSYLHKGWWRNSGGWLRSFFKGNWKECSKRMHVLLGKQQDPYAAYGWMNRLHERYKLKPYYFFLLAARKGRYDKNISPQTKAMTDLVYDHAIRYPIGIHPSWQSGDNRGLLKKEINTLARMTGTGIQSSRQHYIRFTLPATFRRLLEEGIRFDFSMGYGSRNGFRASVASPFYWYDLPAEKQTELLLFPFCYMDANSFYEQQYSALQALEEMKRYYEAVKKVNGIFIMIWHNTFLGTDPTFAGWREIYEQFLDNTVA